MTTYDEYQDRQRLVGRYRRVINSYGTLGEPKEAMIEASLEVFGDFGDPGLPHRYAGVYFIASGPYIKIGQALDPYKRMQPFHGANPHGLELLHVIAVNSEPERRQREKDLHRQFNRLLLPRQREWFEGDPELTEFITSSCARECYPSPT